MKTAKFLLTLGLGFCVAPLFAADYKIDPAHSFVTFRIQHLGTGWLFGNFNTVSGEFSWDEANPGGSSITVNVDPASVDTNHAERDKHIRSGDMLDTGNHGEASFVSSGYSGDVNSGVLSGTLTIKGNSKPIEISISRVGEGKDPWGNYRAGFHGTYELVRADWGDDFNLGPASAKMQVEIGIEGIRK